MKLLTSPILYTHTDHWEDSAFAGTALKHPRAGSNFRVWWFCAAEFREYFDVPAESTKVWLEFHALPAAGRYKAQSTPLGMLYLDGQYVGVIPRVVNMIVRRIKTTDCYVECYYE